MYEFEGIIGMFVIAFFITYLLTIGNNYILLKLKIKKKHAIKISFISVSILCISISAASGTIGVHYLAGATFWYGINFWKLKKDGDINQTNMEETQKRDN